MPCRTCMRARRYNRPPSRRAARQGALRPTDTRADRPPLASSPPLAWPSVALCLSQPPLTDRLLPTSRPWPFVPIAVSHPPSAPPLLALLSTHALRRPLFPPQPVGVSRPLPSISAHLSPSSRLLPFAMNLLPLAMSHPRLSAPPLSHLSPHLSPPALGQKFIALCRPMSHPLRHPFHALSDGVSSGCLFRRHVRVALWGCPACWLCEKRPLCCAPCVRDTAVVGCLTIGWSHDLYRVFD